MKDNIPVKDRCAAARTALNNIEKLEKNHRIEISHDLFEKMEAVRKEKGFAGIGAALEWRIEQLEEMTR